MTGVFSVLMHARGGVTPKTKNGNDYTFWHRFNEKPSTVPGCSGVVTPNQHWSNCCELTDRLHASEHDTGNHYKRMALLIETDGNLQEFMSITTVASACLAMRHFNPLDKIDCIRSK